MKIPIPPSDEMDIKHKSLVETINKLSEKDLYDVIRKTKSLKKYKDKKYTRDDLLRILFWGKQKVGPLCLQMRKWFSSKNLLVEDSGCGAIDKKKPD